MEGYREVDGGARAASTQRACCGRCAPSTCQIAAAAMLVLFAFALAGVLCLFLPAYIDQYVDEQIADRYAPEPGTESYEEWVFNDVGKDPPMYMSFWLFNVTNPDDVAYRAATPVVQEVGPFVYLRHEKKLNVTMAGGTASFLQRVTCSPVAPGTVIDFVNANGQPPTRLVALHADSANITTLNVVLFAAASQLWNNPFHALPNRFARSLCQGLGIHDPLACFAFSVNFSGSPLSSLLSGRDGVFQTKSAAAWISADPDKAEVNSILAFYNEHVLGIENPDSRFGFWYNLTQNNDTQVIENVLPNVVHYNRSNLTVAQTLIRWQNASVLRAINETTRPDLLNTLNYRLPFTGWGEDLYIEGLRNIEFTHPNLGRGERLRFWLEEGARFADAKYIEDVEIHGVKAYLFKVTNESLYPDANDRLNERMFFSFLNGTANLTQFKMLAPIVASLVHYLYFPQLLQQYPLIGMPPASPLEDDTFAIIEPRSGLVISAAERLQMNALITPYDWAAVQRHAGMPLNMSSLLLPLCRFEKRSVLTSHDAKLMREMQHAGTYKLAAIVTGAVVATLVFTAGVYLFQRGRALRLEEAEEEAEEAEGALEQPVTSVGGSSESQR